MNMCNLQQSSLKFSVFILSETQEFTLESTLQELPLYEFQVEPDCLGDEIAKAFQADSMLPGVILVERGQLLGVISRRRFLEKISQPYGMELFLNRPIESLYLSAQADNLVLPGATLIVMAAQRAVYRSPDLLYEPIVVRLDSQVYRLLDVHQLLLVQSQIHEQVTWSLSQLYYELEIANQELQRLATSDGLTGVANRRRFDEYLKLWWCQMVREKTPLSLILCDVDFFKLYNDTYGHPAGDACLQQVARSLSSAVKRSTDLVARYGGEEFAVILPNTDAVGVVHVAAAVRASIKALAIPHLKSTVSPYVTLSLGMASIVPEAKFSPESLIAAADQALYQAKAAGRDRFTLHAF